MRGGHNGAEGEEKVKAEGIAVPEQCKDCPMESRIDNLERANEQHGRTHHEMFDRLNKLEMQNAVQDERHKAVMDKLDEIKERYNMLCAQLGEIANSNATQVQILEEINKRSKKNEERLNSVEAKPIKRLESAKTAIITSIASAIAGAIAGALLAVLKLG